MSNATGFPLLSLILFTPLIGVVVLLFVNRQRENLIKWIANIFVGLGFLVSLPLWFWYDSEDASWQFVEQADWIPSIGAQYFLAVDGFSTLLILLTTLMGVIAVLSSWTAITMRVKEYYIFLLALQTGMLGAFMALDFLLFFLFWEVMLVPMYFLIAIWGSDKQAVFGNQVLPLHAHRQRRDAVGYPGRLLLSPRRDRRVHLRHHAVSTSSTSRSARSGGSFSRSSWGSR